MAANDVAAPLPQLDLLHGSIITVELDDPGAQITALNVHGWQSDPDEPMQAPSPVTGAYIYGGEVA
jgi:hypothetical protein